MSSAEAAETSKTPNTQFPTTQSSENSVHTDDIAFVSKQARKNCLKIGSSTFGSRRSDEALRSAFDDDDYDEAFNDIYLSVCIAANRIGAAFYDGKDGSIHLMDDVPETYSVCNNLKALAAQALPKIIIASARQEDMVMGHLKQLCVSETVKVDDRHFPATDEPKARLCLLRAWDFGLSTCKARIYGVVEKEDAAKSEQALKCAQNGLEDGQAGAEEDTAPVKKKRTPGTSAYTGSTARQQNENQNVTAVAMGKKRHAIGKKGRSIRKRVSRRARLRVAFAINFDATCMVRAFGALLKFLNMRGLGTRMAEHDGENAKAAPDTAGEETNEDMDGVFSLKRFTFKNYMWLEKGVAKALQIFSDDTHPSVFKAGRFGAKEGFSLYGVCNECESGPGALELRRWFLRPLTDREVIIQRQEAVEFFVDQANTEQLLELRKLLQHVRHITKILNRLRLMQASPSDWMCLYKSLFNCYRISELLRLRPKRPALLSEIAERTRGTAMEISVLLFKVVDFDASHAANRFVVNENVDENLDQKKLNYKNLPNVLEELSKQEVKTYQLEPNDSVLVYMPMIGYLLSVPLKEKDRMLEEDGVEYDFTSDGRAYFKTPMTNHLDHQVGDLKMKIIDRETSIRLNLQEIVLDKAETLLDAVSAAAQLDCIIALAVAARLWNWVKPQLVDENIIDVKASRHPLLESKVAKDQLVPNHIYSRGFVEPNDEEKKQADVVKPLAKVHLLTGPNTSGKSVYLKQVGLLVFMAHVGSFVPAESAKIGPIDAIYTRMCSDLSLISGLSAFAEDVRQISTALARAKGRSLVLVDEFGKGTHKATGTALLVASLEYWLRKPNDDCPHVFVCSHLYSVTRMISSPLLCLKTMEVMRNGDEIVFLYKLVDGSSEASHAVYTAQRANLPVPLIERAVEVFNNIRSHAKTTALPVRNAFPPADQKTMSLVERFIKLDMSAKNYETANQVFALIAEYQAARKEEESEIVKEVVV